MNAPICETCMKIHGRDTNDPIQCGVCFAIVGCFWHNRSSLHIRNCFRARAGLAPITPLFDKEEKDARSN